MKHLLAITIALLPSAVLAEQFTPEQLIDVMTKSPSNRDVRVHDFHDSRKDLDKYKSTEEESHEGKIVF